ncbi:hypothetical protein B0H11DRAFT_2193883 [Mycena galericulata]|nr:hypothetical protein B0H11DRAFT_2193883 [Mycena galericulata]
MPQNGAKSANTPPYARASTKQCRSLAKAKNSSYPRSGVRPVCRLYRARTDERVCGCDARRAVSCGVSSSSLSFDEDGSGGGGTSESRGVWPRVLPPHPGNADADRASRAPRAARSRCPTRRRPLGDCRARKVRADIRYCCTADGECDEETAHEEEGEGKAPEVACSAADVGLVGKWLAREPGGPLLRRRMPFSILLQRFEREGSDFEVRAQKDGTAPNNPTATNRAQGFKHK